MEEDEVNFFRQHIKDVQPLPQSNKVSTTKPRPLLKRSPSQRIKHKTQWALHKAETSQVGAFEHIEYQHPSIRKQDWDQLKKGQFKTRWKIDLHGLRQDEADAYLKDFIDQAWSHSARYLIIIHGKGYHSDRSQPLLKNLVFQRCQQNEQVLAFCSAQPKDGGTGAIYVFLKKRISVQTETP